VTVAWFCPVEVIRVVVSECIVKTTREFPIYFEKNEATEFAEEAVRFLNQNRQGSHFVLHSVGNADFTPIVGSSTRITFKAKASNEDDFKEFVAIVKRSYPWETPSYITVCNCILRDDEDDVQEFEKIKTKLFGHHPHHLHVEYDKKLQESLGYNALPLPPRLKADVKVFPEYDGVQLEALSEAAIKFYNEEHGSDFVFHSWVMGNYNHRAGTFYRITFRAIPSKSIEIDDVKEFRARISYCVWENTPVRVRNCTIRANREYPIDFEHNKLVEFSEDALKFFNQEHEGSDFVFRSVVKSSNFIPIGGYSIFVTFMASNEEGLKEFEARLIINCPWSKSSCGARVVYCSVKSSKGKAKVSGD
jgi:hypothetical protein